MRLGLLEIVLIIAVAIAAAVLARILRGGRGTPPASRDDTRDTAKNPRSPETPRVSSLFNRMGIALVIGGIVVLAAAVGLFRWVLQSYLWAFLLIAAGLILLLLARRKR